VPSSTVLEWTSGFSFFFFFFFFFCWACDYVHTGGFMNDLQWMITWPLTVNNSKRNYFTKRDMIAQ
jgi:hypothetical protein